MPDITVSFDAQNLRGDWTLTATDLLTGNDLQSSVIVSLFTEQPWWADAYEPDPIGSRLLTLRRAKHTNDTLLRARDYCKQALAWMIADQVAQQVDVLTEWQGNLLGILITITQATGITRYSFEWDLLFNVTATTGAA